MASSHQGIGIVVALALGALGGWALGRMVRERPLEATAATPAPTAELAPETARSESTSAAQLTAIQEPGARERTAVTDGLPLIHPGLEEYGRDGIRRGWQAVRGSTMPGDILAEGSADYEKLVRESPEAIGRRLGQREDERDAAREDAATGGVFALIATLNEKGAGPMPELVADGQSFSRLFPRAVAEAALNGLNHLEKPDEAIEDGTTLDFPAGVFRLERLMRDKDPFPRDVTISGAGMDATLLLFGNLSTRHQLRNFVVRDCTLFTENDYAFDLRREPASIQFERVRVCGFDMGAGSSCMLQAPGAAFYARDCHIVGGYGRHPEHGQLFRVDVPGLIARFENCRIEVVGINHSRLDPGATVAFVNCVMKDILCWGPPPEELDHRGFVLAGTVIDWLDSSQGKPQTRDLNELFPDWEARVNQ